LNLRPPAPKANPDQGTGGRGREETASLSRNSTRTPTAAYPSKPNQSTQNVRTGPSERSFQDAVTAYARLTGWRYAHHRAARTVHGWRTPVTGDIGVPDLLLARRGRLVFAELKRQGGRLRPEQREWLDALSLTPAEVYVWTPADWPTIERVLR
jgi:hypothetical protein